MPITGPYNNSPQVYEGTPTSYLADQIRNLIFKSYSSGVPGRPGTPEEGRAFIQANENVISQTAQGIQKQINDVIQKTYSRDAAPSEIIGISDAYITPESSPFLRGSRGDAIVFDSEGFLKQTQSDLLGTLPQKLTQLNKINLANKELGTYGTRLPFEAQLQIIKFDLPEANFEKMIAVEKKAATEAKVREEVSGIPAKEEQAISELEKSLGGQQKRYFEEEASPSIMRQLSTRGLLDSGSLATALASEAGKGRERIEGVTTPLRATSRLGGVQRGFEQTLRGALESGRSLEDAINFSRQLYSADKAQQFQTGQAEAAGRREQDIFRQQQGLEMARLPKGPSALDYYLRYGLEPTVNILGGLFSSGKTTSKGGGGSQTTTEFGGSRNA